MVLSQESYIFSVRKKPHIEDGKRRGTTKTLSAPASRILMPISPDKVQERGKPLITARNLLKMGGGVVTCFLYEVPHVHYFSKKAEKQQGSTCNVTFARGSI